MEAETKEMVLIYIKSDKNKVMDVVASQKP